MGTTVNQVTASFAKTANQEAKSNEETKHSSKGMIACLKEKIVPIFEQISSLFSCDSFQTAKYSKDFFNPSLEKLKKAEKLVIIGAGPAGYTAAFYAARAHLKPVVYEGGMESVSQLATTTDVENFPGFPEGIQGPELIDRMRRQAERFGAKLITEDVVSVDFSKYPFIVKGQNQIHEALAVIIATGAKAKRLDIPGTREGELWNHGVSTCATCDGPLPMFRNKKLYVIGGGDSALERALFLTKFASKVYVVHRRGDLRASKILQKRVLEHPKIEMVWNSIITKVSGEKVVNQVIDKNLITSEEQTRDAGGLFFAVGHTPNTAFLQGQVNTDEKGLIKVSGIRTNIPRVYAAGDVHDGEFCQAATAAGFGCMAALTAERDLSTVGLAD